MLAKKMIAVALGMGLAAPALAHKDGHGVSMCDVDSPYDLRIDHGKLTWTRDGGTPQRIEMHRGTLIVDGQPVYETAALVMLLAERHPEAKLLPAPNTRELFAPFADHPRVGLISLMDHTPGQRQPAEQHRGQKCPASRTKHGSLLQLEVRQSPLPL